MKIKAVLLFSCATLCCAVGTRAVEAAASSPAPASAPLTTSVYDFGGDGGRAFFPEKSHRAGHREPRRQPGRGSCWNARN